MWSYRAQALYSERTQTPRTCWRGRCRRQCHTQTAGSHVSSPHWTCTSPSAAHPLYWENKSNEEKTTTVKIKLMLWLQRIHSSLICAPRKLTTELPEDRYDHTEIISDPVHSDMFWVSAEGWVCFLRLQESHLNTARLSDQSMSGVRRSSFSRRFIKLRPRYISTAYVPDRTNAVPLKHRGHSGQLYLTFRPNDSPIDVSYALQVDIKEWLWQNARQVYL